MTQPSAPSGPLSLDEVRRAIDEIDDAMLSLLHKRFALVDGVIAAKSSEPSMWPSPLRPSREMQILKRLSLQTNGLTHDLLVRLWRGIVTEATLKQARVSVHVSKNLAKSMGHRLRIRDYFGRFPVEEWRDETQALVQVNANPGDICVVETESPWIEPFLAGQGGKAQVLGVLPAVREDDVPKLLVLGVAPVQATGEDETLLISKGNLPRDFSLQPVWQAKVGPYRLSSLAGYFSEHESPLVSLTRSNPGLGLRVAGRYASPIEV